MIKPCNQPLKINPFNSYRDPVTGRWSVVPTVQNHETDGSLKATTEGENDRKVETISAAPTVSLPKKRLSFSLPPLKNFTRKSAVILSR